MQRRITVKIIGIVQGVGFRGYVKSIALRFGLNGFAKNLEDGSVLVVAEGEEELLRNLLQLLKKGTLLSEVTNFSYEFQEFKGDLIGFKIL